MGDSTRFAGSGACLFAFIRGFHSLSSGKRVTVLLIEVHTQMPFSNAGRGISVLFGQRCDRHALPLNKRLIKGSPEDLALQAGPPAIASG